MINRETIYAAVFDRVKDLAGLITTSRRSRHWNDVSAAEQPALFQEQRPETKKVEARFPAIHTLNVDLVLYVNVGNDPSAVPATQLNALIDAVEAALEPDPGKEEQTLGGLVKRCRVSGTIEIADGMNMGPQAVAVIPVEIITA